MWNCIVLENHLTHGIDKMIFDFGNEILLVADYDTKVVTRFHGKIAVNEYVNCFTNDEINVLVKNLSQELSKKKEAWSRT